LPGFALLPMGFAAMLSNGPKPEIMLAIDFRGPFCSTFGQAKSGKESADVYRKLPGIVMLLMGLQRCPVTNPIRKSCSQLISGIAFALLFGQSKSSKRICVPNFTLMFFCFDTKEPKNQGSEKIG